MPWEGSPNTNFVGTGAPAGFDAGAIRLENTTSKPIDIASVTVNLHGKQIYLWGSFTIPGKQRTILTQTNPSPQDFDTSDYGNSAVDRSYPVSQCPGPGPYGNPPTITIAFIDGSSATVVDSGRVLDTNGRDLAACPPGNVNESHAWTLVDVVGTTASLGATLHLSLVDPPNTHYAPITLPAVGQPVQVLGVLLDASGFPLPDVDVVLTVIKGPDLSIPLSDHGTTDASGRVVFNVTGKNGDEVQGSVTNASGGTLNSEQKLLLAFTGDAPSGFTPAIKAQAGTPCSDEAATSPIPLQSPFAAGVGVTPGLVVRPGGYESDPKTGRDIRIGGYFYGSSANYQQETGHTDPYDYFATDWSWRDNETTSPGADIMQGTVGLGVYPVAPGVVVKTDKPGTGDYGTNVTIQHAQGVQTVYAHLVTGSILVEPGQVVTTGTQIATVGNTGHTNGGFHLHLRFLVNGPNSTMKSPHPSPMDGQTVCDFVPVYAAAKAALFVWDPSNVLATLSFLPGKSGTLFFPNGSGKISFPIDLVASPTTLSLIQTSSTLNDLAGHHYLGQSFVLSAVDANGKPVTQFHAAYTISVKYDPHQLPLKNGAPVHPALYYFDASSQSWIRVSGQVADSSNNLITAPVDHLTEFAVLDDLAPNPLTLVPIGLAILLLGITYTAARPLFANFSNSLSEKIAGNLERKCPSCGALNPVGVAFCGACGTALPSQVAPTTISNVRCQQCGTENPVSAAFCGLCGTALVTAPPSPAASAAPPAANVLQCPQCGTLSPQGRRFCGACGGSLGSAATSGPAGPG